MILIMRQQKSLAGKFILFVMTHNPHPLCKILSRKIRELSLKRWGVVDYPWAYNPCRTFWVGEAVVLAGVCHLWNHVKKGVVPRLPTSLNDIQNLALWLRSVGYVDKQEVGYKTNTPQNIA